MPPTVPPPTYTNRAAMATAATRPTTGPAVEEPPAVGAEIGVLWEELEVAADLLGSGARELSELPAGLVVAAGGSAFATLVVAGVSETGTEGFEAPTPFFAASMCSLM